MTLSEEVASLQRAAHDLDVFGHGRESHLQR